MLDYFLYASQDHHEPHHTQHLAHNHTYVSQVASHVSSHVPHHPINVVDASHKHSEHPEHLDHHMTTAGSTMHHVKRKYLWHKASSTHWRHIKEHGIVTHHLDEKHRDIASRMALAPLPDSVDLRGGFPEPFNQGRLGSCTANATIGVAMYEIMQVTKKPCDMLSRLFLYYNTRDIEGTVNDDKGANLVDVIISLHKQGVCKEVNWTYSDDRETFKKKPAPACYTEGLKCRDLDPDHTASVAQNLNTLKTILSLNCPIVVGIMIFESFESMIVAKTGVVPMPNMARERCLGGHAVVIVGYDNQNWLMRNSWGKGWGIEGYFKLPLPYLLNPILAHDFLKIGQMTAPTDAVTFASIAFASAKLLPTSAQTSAQHETDVSIQEIKSHEAEQKEHEAA